MTTDCVVSGNIGSNGPQGPPGPISPAFKLTRQGAIVTNTWLLADGIPSNVVGHTIFLGGASIITITIDSGSVSTFDVTIYEHDHATSTSLTTVSVIAAYGANVTTSIPVTQGKSLAAKVSSGTGDDISVALVISQ